MTTVMADASSTFDASKLRVLCLHGYGSLHHCPLSPLPLESCECLFFNNHGTMQDASAFRSKIGDFWWAMKSALDLVFIDAPHLIEGDVHSEGENEGGRGWWISGSAREYKDTCREFEESVKAIEQASKLEGPLDGILGFSQGACMTAMILSLQCLKKVECSFKFGVLVCGFQSRTCPQDHLFAKEGSIDVPTLHIIGDNDTIIPKERAMEILPYFVSPTVLYHPGGHCLPTSSQCKTEYIDFFKKVASMRSST